MTDREKLAWFVGWEYVQDDKGTGWRRSGGIHPDYSPPQPSIEDYIAACEARGWEFFVNDRGAGVRPKGRYWHTASRVDPPSARAALEAAILKALEATGD